jgi:hypothetical protein
LEQLAVPTTTTNPHPDVPLPVGADFGDIWARVGHEDAHRVIMGNNRGVTDSDVIVWASAIQFWDGSHPRLSNHMNVLAL